MMQNQRLSPEWWSGQDLPQSLRWSVIPIQSLALDHANRSFRLPRHETCWKPPILWRQETQMGQPYSWLSRQWRVCRYSCFVVPDHANQTSPVRCIGVLDYRRRKLRRVWKWRQADSPSSFPARVWESLDWDLGIVARLLRARWGQGNHLAKDHPTNVYVREEALGIRY